MQKTLFMMFGYPGAGKTTTAEVLARLTGAVHISSDKMRSKLFTKPSFDQKEHETLYKALDDEAEKLLLAGKSVIYDANLNRLQHRQDKYDISQRTDAIPILLWVQTRRDLAKERASHYSRKHLWPNNETSDQLFDRIANVIEEPTQQETYVAIDGTKVSPEYIKSKLQTAHII